MRDLYKEIHVQRIDKQVAERKKQDMIHNLEMKEKMLERANKQADKQFVGKRAKFRSEKDAFKMVVQQIDNDDQDTKDQKKYLGSELYDILQEVRKLIDLGELDEKEEESVMKPMVSART